MKLIFAEKAWEDYLYWQKTDKKMVNRSYATITDAYTILSESSVSARLTQYRRTHPAASAKCT